MAVANKIKIYPRAGFVSSYNGLKVFASHTSPTADLVELATLSGFASGWNEFTFTNSVNFKYYLIKHPSNYCEAVELEFYDGTTKLTPVSTFSSTEFSSGYVKEFAFDADLGTSFVSVDPTNGYLGIETISALTVSLARSSSSINHGQNITITPTVTGGSGSITAYSWKLDTVEFRNQSSGALGAVEIVAPSGGSHTVELSVTKGTETDTETITFFVGTVSGDSKLSYNETATYSSNVPSPRTMTKESGAGTVAGEQLTAPSSGNGSIVLKFTNNADNTIFATKTVTYPEEPASPVLTAPTLGSNYIDINYNTPLSNGVDSVRIQRADDSNFTQNVVELSDTTIDGVYRNTLSPVPTTNQTFYFRAWAKISTLESLNPSNTVSATFTPPPIITTNSPLQYARIGQNYTVQLQKSGGSGNGSWSAIVQGNLPNGALAADGTITIATVGNSNYNFTARFTDTNGTYVDKAFTIPVTNMALISFCHRRPLEIEIIQNQTIDEALDDNEEVSEDSPMRFNYQMNSLYVTIIKADELWNLLYEHRNRKKFLWFNPDKDETKVVKIIKLSGKREMLNYGEFEFVLQYKSGD